MLTLLPMIITAAAVQFMPDRVPAHYNFEGEIDRWGSRYENFIMPGVIILMTVGWLMAIRFFDKKSARQDIDDKQRREAAQNGKVIYYTAAATTVFETALHCVIMYNDFRVINLNAGGLDVDFYKITGVVIGVLVVALANVIPKAKRNTVVGVRTKWSLADDETWRATQRFGAGILTLGGISVIVESLIVKGLASIIIAVAVLLVCAVMCVIYSYQIYTRGKRGGEDEIR